MKKNIGIVVIVVAVAVIAYWWWSSRGHLSPAAGQTSTIQSTTTATKTASSEAQILQGLKGINGDAINKELQNIDSGQ